MKESELKAAVRLAVGRLEYAVAWVNDRGVAEYFYGSTVQRVAYGVGGPGGADLLCIVQMEGSRFGRWVSLELKAPGGKTDPKRLEDQQRHRALVNRLGGYAVEVRSAEEAIAALECARAGDWA